MRYQLFYWPEIQGRGEFGPRLKLSRRAEADRRWLDQLQLTVTDFKPRDFCAFFP